MKKLLKEKLKFEQAELKDWDNIEYLYIEAFPENERQTCETIKQRLENNKLKLYVVRHEQTIFGFALAWELLSLKTYYIEYFAVNKEYRNNGIGEYILKSFKEYVGDKKLIVEIEDPAIDKTDIDKVRRFDFYKRNDFVLVPTLHYEMPSLEVESESIPMFLLCYSKNKETLTKEFQEEFVKFLYLTVYQKNKNNIYLQKILKSIKHDIN